MSKEQCCGTCGHGHKPVEKDWRIYCLAPVPHSANPDNNSVMMAGWGKSCPCWKPKGESDEG